LFKTPLDKHRKPYIILRATGYGLRATGYGLVLFLAFSNVNLTTNAAIFSIRTIFSADLLFGGSLILYVLVKIFCIQ